MAHWTSQWYTAIFFFFLSYCLINGSGISIFILKYLNECVCVYLFQAKYLKCKTLQVLTFYLRNISICIHAFHKYCYLGETISMVITNFSLLNAFLFPSTFAWQWLINVLKKHKTASDIFLYTCISYLEIKIILRNVWQYL